MAEQVMRTPQSQVQSQRKTCPFCDEKNEDKPLQAKSAGRAENTQAVAHPLIRSARSLSGQPLDAGTRSFMEPRFGQDFGNVRVHMGNSATQLNRVMGSEAFTLSNDIYFNSGRYSPESNAGGQLLAHELTHVVQQSGDHRNIPAIQRRVQITSSAGIGQIIGHFHTLCPGSWSRSGRFITGNALVVGNQSCTCIEDTVNDPSRIYRIQVDNVTNAPRSNVTLYDGTVAPSLPYPSSGPRTYLGSSPLVHMPDSSSSAMDFGAFDPAGNAVGTPYWRILAHELCGHARLNQGYTRTKGSRPEHDSTINTENQIAAEHGGPPRGMYNDPRQGESYHCLSGSPDLVFRLVDGWHYETSATVQSPAITTGPISGTVTASSLRIRQGPSTSTPVVGSYPRGTVIDLRCQTPGTEVGGNTLWDQTSLGFVSDRYVRRPPGSSRVKLPTCDPLPSPATGVIYGRIATATSRLRIRRTPSTSSPVVGSYRTGEMVAILCQTTGDNVLGSNRWDRTSRGYISDRFVERLPPDATVPPCAP